MFKLGFASEIGIILVSINYLVYYYIVSRIGSKVKKDICVISYPDYKDTEILYEDNYDNYDDTLYDDNLTENQENYDSDTSYDEYENYEMFF